MSRRKAMALVGQPVTSSSPDPVIHTQQLASVSNAQPVSMPSLHDLPEIEMTQHGNAFLSLGADELDAMTLDQMIEYYNQSVPQTVTAVGLPLPAAGGPVIYDEPSQAAQNDLNFYTEIGGFKNSDDKLNEEQLASVMMETMGGPETTWTSLAPTSRTMQFDNTYAADTEVMRQYFNLE